MSLAHHFHLDLVVFNLPLFEHAIFGPVPRNFRIELSIFAPIAPDSPYMADYRAPTYVLPSTFEVLSIDTHVRSTKKPVTNESKF